MVILLFFLLLIPYPAYGQAEELNRYIQLNEKIIRLEEIQKSQKENISLALTAAEKAIIKAEAATEKRFDSVNEFRQTLETQQQTFITSKEAEAKFQAIDDKIEILVANQTLNLGKQTGNNETWGYIIGGIGLLIGIFSFFRKSDLKV